MTYFVDSTTEVLAQPACQRKELAATKKMADWLDYTLGQEKLANIELVKEIESYEEALWEA